MKEDKYMKKFFQVLLNPIFIVIYFITLYVFLKLCRYGKGFIPYDFTILSLCIIILLLWIMISIWLVVTKREYIMIKWKYWLIIAISLMLGSALYSGYRVYDMITHRSGVVSHYFDEIFREKELTFDNPNILTGGFNEFMDKAKVTFSMPEELYMNGTFVLKCGYDGKIDSFDVFVYGKKENKTKTYLISYKNGENVKFRLDGYVKETYKEDQKFQPLLDTLKSINLEDYINPFQVKYSGVQNFGYNSKDVFYIDKNKSVKQAKDLSQEIQGYTTVFEPLTEFGPRTKSYIYVDNIYNIPKPPVKKGDDTSREDKDLKSMINDLVGYKLRVTDAAAGSRSYALFKTEDGGVNWYEHNKDPFSTEIGVSSGIVFFNDKLGYIGMSHGGGDNANLYCTKDGGKTFKKVDLKSPEPYDYPSLPYKENGIYNIKVTVGADNDNPKDFLVYTSVDGFHWQVKK